MTLIHDLPEKEHFLRAVTRMASSLWDFEERFDLPPVTDEAELIANLKARLPILVEEVGEMARHTMRDEYNEAILEAADILFVALGTIYMHGWPGITACHGAAQKNDAKTHETHVLSDAGKLVKRG